MTLATPDSLYQAPELATLAILDELLQQTIYALFAAHPELTDQVPFYQRTSLTAEVWVADAIYSQASALQQSIDRYREAVKVTNNFPSPQNRR